MEVALHHASLDEESPYLQPLVQIFSRLPVEDIARCRTLSRSSRRLLYNRGFLRRLPVEFDGFILLPAPSSEFHHYYSLKSGRTFANIPRGPNHFRILSSNNCMLLTTAYGVRWRIVNPLAGFTFNPERIFFRDEFVISATILRVFDSFFHVFFLTTRGYDDAWLVALCVHTPGYRGECDWDRRLLDKSPENRDVRSGGTPRPAVVASGRYGMYVCALFPKKLKVWVVDCRSPKNWMLPLPGADVGGLYSLVRSTGGIGYATCLGADLSIWRLDKQGEEPQFMFFRRVCLNRPNDFLSPLYMEEHLPLPRPRVEHIAGSLVYVRSGRFRILVYNIATSRMVQVMELCTGDDGGGGDRKWPPVFAYSCCLVGW